MSMCVCMSGGVNFGKFPVQNSDCLSGLGLKAGRINVEIKIQGETNKTVRLKHRVPKLTPTSQSRHSIKGEKYLKGLDQGTVLWKMKKLNTKSFH